MHVTYAVQYSIAAASTADVGAGDRTSLYLRPIFSRSLFRSNPLMDTGNYSAASNNMKLVHWLLMGGLLHDLVQR